MNYKRLTHYRKKEQTNETHLETCMIRAVLSTHLEIQPMLENKESGFSNPSGEPKLITKEEFNKKYREFKEGE